MKSVLVGVLLVVAPVAGPSGMAVANEPPLADAGLDQQVEVGSAVRLDATGSRDSDGEISDYEWTIEAPNGTTTSPACGSCGSTSFRPLRIGQYNVTVTVTDDDGATRTDTLYLTVGDGTAPSVSLSGTERPAVGTTETYTAGLSAGTVPLDRVEWHENGTDVENQSVSGDSQSVSHEVTFSDATPRNLSVTAVDVAGQQTTQSLVVTPERRTGGVGSFGGADGGMGNGNLEGYNYEGPTVTEHGGQDYYDPQAADGAGRYIDTPGGPTSEADAVNYITGEDGGSDAFATNDGSDDGGSSSDGGGDNDGSDSGTVNEGSDTWTGPSGISIGY